MKKDAQTEYKTLRDIKREEEAKVAKTIAKAKAARKAAIEKAKAREYEIKLEEKAKRLEAKEKAKTAKLNAKLNGQIGKNGLPNTDDEEILTEAEEGTVFADAEETAEYGKVREAIAEAAEEAAPFDPPAPKKSNALKISIIAASVLVGCAIVGGILAVAFGVVSLPGVDFKSDPKPDPTVEPAPTSEPTVEPTPSSEPTPTPGGDTYSTGLSYGTKEDGTSFLKGIGSCTDVDLNIPRVSTTLKPLTEVGEGAFRNAANLHSVTLPEGVTVIGKSAFSGCKNLETVVLPSTVTEIKAYAFSGCSSLKVILLPEGLSDLGVGAFEGCSFVSVTLPASLSVLPENAFAKNPLESVTLGAGVASCDPLAFSSCKKLVSLSVDPANATYTAVGNCLVEKATKKLVFASQNAPIPADGSVSAIGANAYAGNAITKITIPASVTAIGMNAFKQCHGLTEVTVPVTVETVAGGAFAECGALRSISLEGLSVLETGLLYGCLSLEKVTLSETLTEIKTNALAECPELTAILYSGSVDSWDGIKKWSNWITKGYTLDLGNETYVSYPAP